MRFRKSIVPVLFISLLMICCLKIAHSDDLSTLPVLGDMPEFRGIDVWIGSPPLSKEALKGKVVLVDFWTYSCVNCLRTLPHLNELYAKYKDAGLVIVGVHSPEFDFEKDPENVRMAVKKLNIPYPIAVDSKMETWDAYSNNAWPAHYFIDGNGKIRYIHLGEGDYDQSEKVIQTLLKELPPSSLSVHTINSTPPSQIASVDFTQIQSPETYLGTARRENFNSSKDNLKLNDWSLEGNWDAQGEYIKLLSGTGKILIRFKANKANLVLKTDHPSEAIIKLDGKIVSLQEAGKDVKEGKILINEPRLYELINLGKKGEDHVLEIEFLTPGVEAFAFTFG